MAFKTVKAENIILNGAVTGHTIDYPFLANKGYKVGIWMKKGSINVTPFTIKLDAVTMHTTTQDLTAFASDFKYFEYTLSPTADRAQLIITITGGNNATFAEIVIFRDITTEEQAIIDAEIALEAAETEEDRRQKAQDAIIVLAARYVQKFGFPPALTPDKNDSLDSLLVLINFYNLELNK